MTDQPRLLPPSAGIQVLIRRLLEVEPRSTEEAFRLLKRTWKFTDYATADLAYAHYLDATTAAEPVIGNLVEITVAPLSGIVAPAKTP